MSLKAPHTIASVIVDDHLLVAQSLRLLVHQLRSVRVKVVHLSDGQDINSWPLEEQIRMVLLDLNLGHFSGIDLIQPIKEKCPDSKILVVSGYRDSQLIKTAFLSGADGYVLKQTGSEELERAIRSIMEDNTYMGAGVQFGVPKRKRDDTTKVNSSRYLDAYDVSMRLTRREKEVLELINQALTNKEIAKELYISDQTVSVHRKNIMRKLGVTNSLGLMRVAQKLL